MRRVKTPTSATIHQGKGDVDGLKGHVEVEEELAVEKSP